MSAPDTRLRALGRLRAALFGRPSPAQVVIAVLVALLGFAAATQVRINNDDDDLVGERGQDLVVLLDSLTQRVDRARDDIEDLQAQESTLETERDDRSTSVSQLRTKLQNLQILAGTVAARGPGIRITLKTPAGTLQAADLLDAIEEMRDAGAEAMEFDDRVRVVASTAITQSDGVVYADGVALDDPVIVDVIGSPHTLEQAVTFRGGLSTSIESIGGTVDVVTSDAITVGSVVK